jgi:ADP-ribose pyrophosphatase
MRVFEGKFMNVIWRNSWEFAERPNITGIVGILAITKERKMVLVEQYREPVQKFCIEIPAGLIGDHENESLEDGAKRELLEETGYTAGAIKAIGNFPISPGMTSEVMTIMVATDLVKTGKGGGTDADEDIKVVEIPLLTAPQEILKLTEDGTKYIDCKVFLAAYFAYQEFTHDLLKSL